MRRSLPTMAFSFPSYRLVLGKPHHRPGQVLDVEIAQRSVLGGLHRVARVGRCVHEGAGRDDAPVLADDGVQLFDGKDQELIRVIVELGTRTRLLGHHAEVHVAAFDDRRPGARQMGRKPRALVFLESMKGHDATLLLPAPGAAAGPFAPSFRTVHGRRRHCHLLACRFDSSRFRRVRRPRRPCDASVAVAVRRSRRRPCATSSSCPT